MSRHVEGQLHAGCGHARAACAEKARLKAGVEWLVIGSDNGITFGKFLAQGMDEFCGEQIAAGLARD